MQRIRLARAYAVREGAPTEGARVLVDRLWPRGIAKANLALDLWAKEAAPSDALRHWFGHDPARWEAFARRYREELAAKPEAVEDLLALCRKGPVTLIYAARDETRNHALCCGPGWPGGWPKRRGGHEQRQAANAGPRSARARDADAAIRAVLARRHLIVHGRSPSYPDRRFGDPEKRISGEMTSAAKATT